MIRINVTITNAIGTWVGFMATNGIETAEQANSVVDQLIENTNNIKHLAITHEDGSQSTFPEGILAASVIYFHVSA